MLEERRVSGLVPLYKGKGDVQQCNNYRGIKLLSQTMKIWEKVIDTRLGKVTGVASNQFGFVPGKSRIQPVFMLRQMMEKHRSRKALEGKGLRVNREKTECMKCKWDEKKGTVGEIKIEGQSIKKEGEYRYLGALMKEDGEIDREVGARVQTGWMKWREGKE